MRPTDDEITTTGKAFRGGGAVVEALSYEAVARMIVARRRVEGAAAVLLPYRPDGVPDLDGFSRLVAHIAAQGLIPAVNMDTGYVDLLSPAERGQVLQEAARTLAGRPFIAGVYVGDDPGDLAGAYRRDADRIRELGGLPILFPCARLRAMAPGEQLDVYRRVAAGGGPLLAFELSPMFTPAGFLFSEELYRGIVELPEFVGMKHSSLSRRLEWQRLDVRNRVRKEFRIYTGNDLAIDMVIYGSDYLLGLAAFVPEAFALRDDLWEAGDVRFFELNDALQYLGQFAFRPPVPAYKHSAAQFLHLLGRITSDAPHPGALKRPDSDRLVLEEIARRLQGLMDVIRARPHEGEAGQGEDRKGGVRKPGGSAP
ncbi:MAG: dihydrodipicolinate synthase family protein [Bacillota bacterium]